MVFPVTYLAPFLRAAVLCWMIPKAVVASLVTFDQLQPLLNRGIEELAALENEMATGTDTAP